MPFTFPEENQKCFSAKYLEVYFQKTELDISNDEGSPLIYSIYKTKSGYKISKTKGILYSRIREIFKGYISEITTTPEKFSLHSLTLGGASPAANNGISDRLIFKQSHWSSEKAMNDYTKDSTVKRLNTCGL